MNKRDLKSLALMGIASGALIASQAGAEEMTINVETTLAAGCGGGGACGGATPPPPQPGKNGSNSNYQPSKSGHSCGGQSNYNSQPQNTNKSNQGSNYSQKNTRYSRQIAEGEETAPPAGETVQPPKKEGQNGCGQQNGCGGKKPSQYRTRS
ncbi:hypothetical protein [Estrella lausannensis]|uniref:Putative secreted protein n=1 Tax=Estrella lausannensis TaxID=483423 RepID=A0A0H5E2R4_9BACT|nr:hypothetical protein [Estrella lausannensis]CRX37490.1 Putative secreted protein [Estrella lausannensis]